MSRPIVVIIFLDKGVIMKNLYTNFILTVIAVALIGILFKGEAAYAVSDKAVYMYLRDTIKPLLEQLINMH